MNDDHGSRLNILAIDDAADVLGKISAIAAEAGYTCRCVRDAQGARDSVRQATPDLIISAISLAGHSGVAICDELKQQIGHADLPVMFLSAAQGPDIIRRATRLAARTTCASRSTPRCSCSSLRRAATSCTWRITSSPGGLSAAFDGTGALRENSWPPTRMPRTAFINSAADARLRACELRAPIPPAD